MKNNRLVSVMMAILLFLMSAISVAANEDTSKASLYIISRECPDRILDYARTNYVEYASSHLEYTISGEKIALGRPFSVDNTPTNMFLFPIFSNGRVILVLRVVENDDGIHGTISDFLSNNLNEILDRRTDDASEFFITDNTFCMRNGEQTIKIMEFPAEANLTVKTRTHFETEDKAVINSCEYVEVQDVSPVMRDIAFTYIEIPRTETQGSNSWCQAYCTAAIARYRGFSGCTARSVMTYTYGSNPSTSYSLTDGQVVAYAHAIGLTSVTNSSSYLSDSTLKNHINGLKPVTLVMRNSSSGGYHATVLRGYNSTHWSIWNPWYTGYESFKIGQNYVTQGGTVYQYGSSFGRGRTIYNW